MGKDMKVWLRGGKDSHATCLWVFVSLFFSFNLISQLHSVALAFAQADTNKIVHQCYKWSSSYSIVSCCQTDFILIPPAWNTWLRVSSWAPCLKSEVKSRRFFPISDIIYLKHMYWTQEISATLYSLIKALPKKCLYVLQCLLEAQW